jgi:hypothetical protein
MRLLSTILTLALVSDAVVASSNWFGTRDVYNNWHETELDRWLTDHDIPHPKAADRKDMLNLVKENWDSAVAPFKKWPTPDLEAYLKSKGHETKGAAESNRNALLSEVSSAWYETEEKAAAAWGSTKDWILDTWSESHLVAFAEKHGIKVPKSHTKETLLQKVRNGYQAAAEKAGQTIAYPGDWLYESWSDSDLKEWLDSRGFPAPQPSTRDKLVASVRRNSRLAYLKSQEQLASASASASAAYATLTEKLIDSWTESQLVEFADKNNINVPHGSKPSQIRAIIRKHRAEVLNDSLSAKASNAFGAATSSASNQYAQATDDASLAAQSAFNDAVDTWSDSRLKAYLDARGVNVPQPSTTDELKAHVRRNSHKAAVKYNSWSWDDLSYNSLKSYLVNSGNDAAKKVGQSSSATRDDLVSAARSAYASASSAGDGSYASATSYLSQATDAAKSTTFDTWSDSELKSYLDSYGVKVPQGSTLNHLKAEARKQSTYFKYGTTNPVDTVYAKFTEGVKDTYQWVLGQLGVGANAAKKKVDDAKKEL